MSATVLAGWEARGRAQGQQREAMASWGGDRAGRRVGLAGQRAAAASRNTEIEKNTMVILARE